MKLSFYEKILAARTSAMSAFEVHEIPHRAKLDQNESPFDVPQTVKDAIWSDINSQKWNLYPQPKVYQATKEKFAQAVGFSKEQIILTVGGDQLIFLAFLAAGGPGSVARVFQPAYPMFAAIARQTRTPLEEVPLGPRFELCPDTLGAPVDLQVLVSPNNPTGNLIDQSVIQKAVQTDGLVLLDEAYGDYAGISAADLLDDFPNLLILRSLSKSLLASARVGYGIGHPDVIAHLEDLIFSPYHLNVLQLAVARNYDLILPHLQKAVVQVRSERERVTNQLRQLGLTVYDSQANFVLFKVQSVPVVMERLLSQGIRIRDVSKMPKMENHLRVTIGNQQENSLFLSSIKSAL